MSYEVKLRVQIHGCFATASSRDRWMYRDVVLPIPPCLGLEVGWRSEAGPWSYTIEQLYVDADSGLVEAYIGPERMLYEAELQGREPEMTLDELVADYESQGWTLEQR